MTLTALSGGRMASWELTCVNCERRFAQFIIEDVLVNYYLPMKPVFPDAGAEFQCPHCGYKDVYQRTDLTYKA